MKIELGKIYVDTLGGKWRVASVTGPSLGEVIAVGDTDAIRLYSMDGKLYNNTNHLVSEYNPWNDVKVDTPVWVRDSPASDWVPRHFAGLRDGKFLAWTNGGTSHSTMAHRATIWAEATLRRPESTLADEQA